MADLLVQVLLVCHNTGRYHFVHLQGPHRASVKEGLAERKAGRLLFLWYEDMKADLPNAIRLNQFSAGKKFGTD